MRILHTADWHLGDRLGRIDRTDDLRVAVERVAKYCRDERVDVLLVAGDLFSELARPDGLRESIQHWQEVFREFLEGGGTILCLTGNHDNENFCQTLVHAMSLAAPASVKLGEVVSPGRLYLAPEPTFLRLRDREEGFDVQFVLMPFPTPSRYLRGEAGMKYGSPEEKNALLVEAWGEELARIRGHEAYDAKAPAVLGAHVHVRGAQVGSNLFRMTNQEDVIVESSRLPDQFDYVALGHIHKAQFVAAENVRYSGSIEKMDLGEQGDQKGVVLVDLGPSGLRSPPVVLPLPSTTIYEVVIRDPTGDLPQLQREYPNASRDLVNLHISYTAGVDHLEVVLGELEKIFPRWYARDWRERNALGTSLSAPALTRTKGFAETVRDYLAQELAHHPDSEREAILGIAEDLLKQMD